MTWQQFFSQEREKATNKADFDQYVTMYEECCARIAAEPDEERRQRYINKRNECRFMLMKLTKQGYFA